MVSEVSRRPRDRLWPRHDARACQVDQFSEVLQLRVVITFQ